MTKSRNHESKNLASLVEDSLHGVLVHRDLKPVYANLAWARLHGYTVAEVMAMPSVEPLYFQSELQPPNDFSGAQLYESGEPAIYDYQGLHKDGTTVWFQNLGRVVCWDGEPAICFTITDIDDRKQREERLIQASELASIGHWAWDSATDKSIYTSEVSAHICGLTREQHLSVCSEPGGYLNNIHEDDIDNYRKTIEELRLGKNFRIEYRQFRPDGEMRHVLELGKPVFNNQGDVVQEFGITQDITDRKNITEELARSEARFIQAAKLADLSIGSFYGRRKKLRI